MTTKYKNNFRQKMNDRFDGFGYGMWLLVIVTFAGFIIADHGWPIGIFTFVLMVAVLELCYQLYDRQS